MKETGSSNIYRYDLTVPESALDMNGHVNNVVYVQWGGLLVKRAD